MMTATRPDEDAEDPESGDYAPTTPDAPEDEPEPGPSAGGDGEAGSTQNAVYKAPSLKAKEAAQRYTKIVNEVFENTEHGWRAIVEGGTALVREAGSVRAAAESLWEVREECGLMNLRGVSHSRLDDLLHPDLLQYLRGIRREGMPARYVGERSRVKAKMHPNAKRNVDQVYKQIAKDAKLHRVLVVDGNLEELKGTVSSPFEAVDKMLPDRSVSSEKRVVHDQRTINAGTSKWFHPPALQPSHSQVARRVIWARSQCPGVPILLSKKDISGAFRLLWVSPGDVELFAGDLPWQPFKAFGHEPEAEPPVQGDVTVIYLVSSFGFSGSPGEWTMWGRATEEYHRSHKPRLPRRDMSFGFDSKVLVDDCVLVEPWVGFRPWISSEVFEDGVRSLLGDKAVNLDKDKIEGPSEPLRLCGGSSSRRRRKLPPCQRSVSRKELHC